jgi:hypothetical protein
MTKPKKRRRPWYHWISEMRNFHVQPDAAARAWLESHPSPGPLVIAYDVSRCCGGGKICSVSIRERSRSDRESTLVPGGPDFLIDPRAAARLPERIGLTVRGRGPFRRLDLDLEPEQWGDLLYT